MRWSLADVGKYQENRIMKAQWELKKKLERARKKDLLEKELKALENKIKEAGFIISANLCEAHYQLTKVSGLFLK